MGKYVVSSKRPSEVLEAISLHEKKYKAHGGGVLILDYGAQSGAIPTFEESFSYISHCLQTICETDLSEEASSWLCRSP